MALKIDITDEKGVKTRYHKIKSLAYEGGTVTITMRGYVNQATRDAEKEAIESNTLAEQYDQTTEELRTRLDSLSAQLSPNGEGDPEVIAEIKDLSQQVNDRVSAVDRPRRQPIVDKYYDEQEVVIDYFEPLTLEGIYNKLASDGRYAGAESI